MPAPTMATGTSWIRPGSGNDAVPQPVTDPVRRADDASRDAAGVERPVSGGRRPRRTAQRQRRRGAGTDPQQVPSREAGIRAACEVGAAPSSPRVPRAYRSPPRAYRSHPAAWYCTRIWLFSWFTSTGTASMSAGNSKSVPAMAA